MRFPLRERATDARDPEAVRLAVLGTRGIPARYGGFETFAEQLATRLVRRGIEVTVYCEGEASNRPAFHDGVKLRYVPAPAVGPLSTILFDLRCLWDARSGFDVVYLLGYGASPFSSLMKVGPRRPRLWINMDGLEWQRAKWGPVARWWLKRTEAAAVRLADVVICDAEEIEKSLRRRHPRMGRSVVIPYGAEIPDQLPDGGLPGRLGLAPGRYFLCVCRLEPENHVLEIVRGVADAQSDTPLIVVGDHTRKTKYVSRLRQYSGQRVRFVGPVYGDDLVLLRSRALAYFHGHSVGGTNPSLLEAMAAGNVVVAHDNAFNREVLGDAGFYFQHPDDLSRIVHEVVELGEDQKAARRDMGLRRILDRYTWNAVASEYEQLLAAEIAR